MIKAMFFDVGNVLVFFDVKKLTEPLAKISGKGEEAVRKILFRSEMMEKYMRGLASSENYYRYANEALGLGIRIEEFKELWCGIFRRNDAAVKTYDDLRRKMDCFIISDTNEWHFEKCAELVPSIKSAKGLVLSFGEHARKPESKMYEAALAMANAKPEEVLYIDDMEKNTEAGRALGLNVIHYVKGADLKKEIKEALG